jgi:hypothetical protein
MLERIDVGEAPVKGNGGMGLLFWQAKISNCVIKLFIN